MIDFFISQDNLEVEINYFDEMMNENINQQNQNDISREKPCQMQNSVE